MLSREELKNVFAYLNIDKLEHILVIWTEVGDEENLQMASNDLKYGEAVKLLKDAYQLFMNAAEIEKKRSGRK